MVSISAQTQPLGPRQQQSRQAQRRNCDPWPAQRRAPVSRFGSYSGLAGCQILVKFRSRWVACVAVLLQAIAKGCDINPRTRERASAIGR